MEVINRRDDSVLISEEGHRRVMRWPCGPSRQNGDQDAMIISNQCSFGLAMDDEGSLYVSMANETNEKECSLLVAMVEVLLPIN